MHQDEEQDFVDREMVQIREQIALEQTYSAGGLLRGFAQLFSKRYIKRVALGCFIQTMTQFAGVGVIQNFQSIFYNAVGFRGNTALLISAIYGFMGVIGQVISLTLIADKWKRTTTLWMGCLVLAINLAICMALSAEFSDGSNLAASRATIAFIFLYSCCYGIFFNSTVWVVASEILPVFLRSKALGLAAFYQRVASIVVSQITPIAMNNISWHYYAVFIATNVLSLCVHKWVLPETQGLTLEEVGVLFGDHVAAGKLNEIPAKVKVSHSEERKVHIVAGPQLYHCSAYMLPLPLSVRQIPWRTRLGSTSTTAPACPTPPITCNNLGFDWAYYSNTAQNTDTTYSNFHPASFKQVNPLYVGTTPYVGGLYQPNSENAPGPIYGSSSDLNLDYFALNHHAYIYACEAGTYQFNVPYANDAVYLWLGAKAYAGWAEANADAKTRYNQPDHIAGSASFSIDLPAGVYVPIRLVYGQAQYGGGFYFTITTPSGQVIVSNEATSSPYVVRYSCDGILAPEYPPFGQEI
ncbi:PA14 domain-containing protein [Fusarium sp. LHS14.1]|nr:PA14 domain-containing protein [Fusarium sp. LHS14.1]